MTMTTPVRVALTLLTAASLTACGSPKVDSQAMVSDLSAAGITLKVTPDRYVELTRDSCDDTDAELDLLVAVGADQDTRAGYQRTIEGMRIAFRYVCPDRSAALETAVAKVTPPA